MKLLKNWIELTHEVKSIQLWWSLALLICFSDYYFLMRFDIGFVACLERLQALAEAQHNGDMVKEMLYFLVATVLSWFYLLPLLIVPLWDKMMFEIKMRFFPKTLDISKEWHLLSIVKKNAALTGNTVLYAHCEARRNELERNRHRLVCAVGITLFTILAYFSDSMRDNSLSSMVISAFSELSIAWRLLLFFASIPGLLAFMLILSCRIQWFDPYIWLPGFNADMADKAG